MSKRPSAPGVGHTIEIAAPAETVWAVIADLNGWGAWNPLYTHGAGEMRAGARPHFTVQLEGLKPQHVRPTIVTVEPGRLFEYALSHLGGLLKAFRYVAITPLGPDRCAVANYEVMTGPLGKFVARQVGEKVRQGLEAMNRALKARVEGG